MENITDVEGRHKCAHEECLCQVPSTQEYCSEYCSDADDVSEVVLNCNCGHTPCTLN